MSHISHISPPDISFAHDYRAHVLSQITSLMPVSACLIVLNRASYCDEYNSIVRVAWHLGGWFLREDLWIDLEDWISDRLVEAIDIFEAEFEEDEEQDLSQDIISREMVHVG